MLAGFFLKDFVMYPRWQLYTNYFSQFWLHARYESRKKPGSFYILGYLLELIVKIWCLEILANLDHFSHEKNRFY
jgi:hypothetical protein